MLTFDDAGGHINVNQGYHYHAATGLSYSIAQPDGHAPLIGYALDGHAIYDLLDAEGIVAMAPTPRLVVLSACETGEGELVGGEGILGLVRAFRLSGSSRIVASLWKADDAAAAKLMGALHSRLMAGKAPAHSLALARREVLEEGFVHPFGWGGFVLYGAD